MIPIPVLRRAVEERYGCVALLREIVHTSERIDERWDGIVVLFTLTGHPSANIAYTWCDPGPSPDRLQLQVVLHGGPVDSPEAAVRLSRMIDRSTGEQVS